MDSRPPWCNNYKQIQSAPDPELGEGCVFCSQAENLYIYLFSFLVWTFCLNCEKPGLRVLWRLFLLICSFLADNIVSRTSLSTHCCTYNLVLQIWQMWSVRSHCRFWKDCWRPICGWNMPTITWWTFCRFSNIYGLLGMTGSMDIHIRNFLCIVGVDLVVVVLKQVKKWLCLLP